MKRLITAYMLRFELKIDGIDKSVREREREKKWQQIWEETGEKKTAQRIVYI